MIKKKKKVLENLERNVAWLTWDLREIRIVLLLKQKKNLKVFQKLIVLTEKNQRLFQKWNFMETKGYQTTLRIRQ